MTAWRAGLVGVLSICVATGSVAPVAYADSVGHKVRAEEPGGWDAALRAAQRSGEPVEVGSLLEESAEVFALPNGLRRRVVHAVPQRFKRGDQLVDIDGSLREVEGRLVPGEVGFEASVSVGGRGSVVEVSSGEGRFELLWPGLLAAPVVDGSVARFPGACTVSECAGGDLVVWFEGRSVNAAVFPAAGSEVVGAWPAGSSVKLRGPVVGKGGSLRVGQGPDSLGVSFPQGSRLGSDVVDLVGVGAVRASVGMYSSTRAMVDATFPDQSYDQWAEPGSDDESSSNIQGAGHIPAGKYSRKAHTKRLFWQFDLHGMRVVRPDGGVAPVRVTDSVFQVNKIRAFNKGYAAFYHLRGTGVQGPGITWNSMARGVPAIDGEDTAANNTPGVGWRDFRGGGLNYHLQKRVDDGTYLSSLVLFGEEGDGSGNGWGKFGFDAKLSIDYFHQPWWDAFGLRDPANLPCVKAASRDVNAPGLPFTSNRLPYLFARANDGDGGQFTTHFRLDNQAGGEFGFQIDKPGGRGEEVVAWAAAIAPALTDGFYTARFVLSGPGWPAHETQNYLTRTCDFAVDGTRPDKRPGVMSSDYPSGGVSSGAIGRQGVFSVDSGGVGDVAGWRWALNSDVLPSGSEQLVKANQIGGTGELVIAPTQVGPNVLRVWSVDRAGNPSEPAVYEFSVSASAAGASWWMDDADPGTLTDRSGRGRNGVGSGGARLEPGRWSGVDPTDRALTLPNSGARFSVNAGNQSLSNVDTSRSFSVSTWVRLGSVVPGASVISQGIDGLSGNLFELGTVNAQGKWTFSMMPRAGGVPVVAVSDVMAEGGQWVHLTGVHSAPSAGHPGTLRLFVDGRLAGVAHRIGGGVGVSSKPLTAGGAWGPGGLVVDEVELYPGALDSGQVVALGVCRRALCG